MTCCNHDWIRQTKDPILDYIDYDSNLIGVIVYKCSKCGKFKKKKYLDNSQLGQLVSLQNKPTRNSLIR